ncbi:hypothetical protein PTTG_25264 [Puccinia triticina 1-1 BBBD Race 1]|uniref:Uncharacterized protein n=1 Tax=Puccinia triticina (isolate 1-1 / race 1 (BBBD)) TaxID=630390 RepID=A0A180H5B9_PUCT1|nr:hypothetical protein PTTG_25264 [Puccinia triticina 1-1 BBBD Race 1]
MNQKLSCATMQCVGSNTKISTDYNTITSTRGRMAGRVSTCSPSATTPPAPPSTSPLSSAPTTTLIATLCSPAAPPVAASAAARTAGPSTASLPPTPWTINFSPNTSRNPAASQLLSIYVYCSRPAPAPGNPRHSLSTTPKKAMRTQPNTPLI